MLKPYIIIITMPGGSRGWLRGHFASDWDAIDCALAGFHDAAHVRARRLAA